MENCIFCQIVAGKIPSSKLYEDEHVLSFLDINPINHGHSLVIPKRHFQSIIDIDEEDIKRCFAVTKKVAMAIKDALQCEGINIIQNNFRAAGQVIDHFHIHIIPRFEGDGFLTSWPGKPYKDSSLMDSIREKVVSKIG